MAAGREVRREILQLLTAEGHTGDLCECVCVHARTCLGTCTCIGLYMYIYNVLSRCVGV